MSLIHCVAKASRNCAQLFSEKLYIGGAAFSLHLEWDETENSLSTCRL